MTGLVAIVSADRETSVDDEDVQGLVGCYESLRGAGARDEATGGPLARVVWFGREREDGGIERRGSSWVAASGRPHASKDSLIGLPLHELDGQFALVSYDADREEVCVASDPFGMHALYVGARANSTYVSTSALALAKHLRARPSRLGISIFLRAGAHFGTMTNWEGIERVEPGTRIRFTRHAVERDVYWRPSPDPRVSEMSFDRTVDHCLDVAIQALKATFGDGGPWWTDLTGGFDTRLMNSLLESAGIQFSTNTRDEEAADARLSREVAGVAGWESVHLRLPAGWADALGSMVRTALAWGDANIEVLELSWVLWAHRELGRSLPALLSGGGGEHFQYHAWKSEFLHAGRSNRVNFDNWVAMRLLRPVNTGLFARDPTLEVRADLARRMASWVEPYSSELNTTQLDLLYAYKMTGHCGAYLSADHAYLSAELPYDLKDVLTAAVSTNYRFRNGHRLMRSMQERLNPRVAAITTTSGGTAEPFRPNNIHRSAPYYGTLLRKAANKVSQKLGAPVLPTVAHFDPAPMPTRRSLLVSLGDGAPLSSSRMRSAPLYRRGALDDFLAAAFDGGPVDTALLGRILTIELALRAVDAGIED